jgi:hypothetical protein
MKYDLILFRHLENCSEINFSCLQGYVNTTYDNLVKTFGEPTLRDGDKTTVEWQLKFYNGDVVTIYDYNQWDTPTGYYDWHIGGFNKNAQYLVEKALFFKRG